MIPEMQPGFRKKSLYNMLALRDLWLLIIFSGVNLLLGNNVPTPQQKASILPNRGQWDAGIIAKISMNGGDFWVTNEGFKWLEWNTGELSELHHDRFGKHRVNANVTFLKFNQSNEKFKVKIIDR